MPGFIPVVSGAVVEAVAALVFYLYGKMASQMEEFHSRLERLQRYLVANSICERLQEPERNKTRAELIHQIAAVAEHAPTTQ